MKKVTVSDKGQIALPVAILRQTGIRPGDRLAVTQKNGRITLVKNRGNGGRSLDRFWSMMREFWTISEELGSPDLEKKLWRERRREARKEARRLRYFRGRRGTSAR